MFILDKLPGKKGQHVWTSGNDAEELSRGVYNTYTSKNLRYSQVSQYVSGQVSVIAPCITPAKEILNCNVDELGVCLQVAPLDMFKEVNTGTNLPAQIELYATTGNEYHFLFIAKGSN